MAARSNRANTPIQGSGNQMSEASDTMAGSVWDSAPDEPIIPFLTNEQRADLINTQAELNVTGMDWDKNGRFGPCFVATFIVKKTGDAYQYSFTANVSRPSPRDKANKWMWAQIRNGNGPIPAQLYKQGAAFFLDRPGKVFDVVGQSATSADGPATDTDTPPF